MSADQTKTRWGARGPHAVGYAAVLVLAIVLGGWGTQTRLSGAVMAPGTLEVESKTQVVQHQEGGVVTDILARDGDIVAAGDILFRLDDTFIGSELSIVEGQLFEMLVRRARLEAERDGHEALSPPTYIKDLVSADARMADLFKGQQTLFDARIDTMIAELDQLDEQARQIGNQIDGINAELGAVDTQLDLIASERADAEQLLSKGLVEKPRLLALKREEAGLHGRIGRMNAEIARLRGQQSALEVRELGYRTARREEAITQLRDITYRGSELSERRIALQERLARLDIRSPVAGKVFGSTVFAVQSVIQAGAPVAYVVPDDQPLIVNARLNAVDIDKVYAGQEAAIRFSALDLRHTPEITGMVLTRSADALVDQATGMSFYEVKLLPSDGYQDLLGEQQIVPGMPAEIFIKTGERTPLDYLVKPLADYFNRALREE